MEKETDHQDNKKELFNKLFPIIITIIYAVITAIIALHHENWRDENQAWLLCKNLSIIDLWKQLKHEGHPFLFFAIIYPFISLGCSVKIVNILSWIFMTISTYIIAKSAPVNKLAKIAILITVPFAYQYVIVGRNYSLIVLLITILCSMYKKQKKHPIIFALILGALVNTHTIMIGFVSAVTLVLYIYELTINRKNNTKEEKINLLKGLGVIILSFILLFMQLMGTTKTGAVWTYNNIQEIININLATIINYPTFLVQTTGISPAIILTLGMTFTILGLMYYKKGAIVFIISIIYENIIITLLYGAAAYIYQIIYLILIYSIWTSLEEKKETKEYNVLLKLFSGLLIIISIFSIKSIYNFYRTDYLYNYSSANQLAEYINNNLPENSICITYQNDAMCSTVIPYLKTSKLWSLKSQKYYTFISWNELIAQNDIEGENTINIIKQNFEKEDNLYYISIYSLSDSEKNYLKNKGLITELYKTNTSVMGEEYIIYKINIQ